MDLSLFMPGKRVLIEMHVGLMKHKALSRIIGVREPDFLLVDMPTADGVPLLTERDEPCVVHLMDEGRILGLPARLYLALHEPFAMGILQHAGKAQEKRVREQERVDCNFDAQVCPRAASQQAGTAEGLAPQGIAFRCALIDLSTSGCQLAIPLVGPEGGFLTPLGAAAQIHEGDRSRYTAENLALQFVRGEGVDLAFEMPRPAPGRYKDISCHVRWLRPSGSVVLAGLRFDEPTPAFRASVGRIIESQRRFYTGPVQSE